MQMKKLTRISSHQLLLGIRLNMHTITSPRAHPSVHAPFGQLPVHARSFSHSSGSMSFTHSLWISSAGRWEFASAMLLKARSAASTSPAFTPPQSIVTLMLVRLARCWMPKSKPLLRYFKRDKSTMATSSFRLGIAPASNITSLKCPSWNFCNDWNPPLLLMMMGTFR